MQFLIKHILLIVTFIYSVTTAYAQLFPVTINARVNNPAPINFSNYADQTVINGPLSVQLLLSDVTITNRQVQLRVSFEGNGIQAQSAPVLSGIQPIFINGGVPLNLNSFELGAYFNLNNLVGINPNTYATSIPEGSYQFCFEVFDFITGNRLSAQTCTSIYIFQNEPPFLVFPTDRSVVDASLQQNIVFQWTPRHINVTNVEYELSIVEIWDHMVDPETAFFSSPPVFVERVTNTRLLYGPDKPLLLDNKRYAWRVQAIARQGAEDIGFFTNNGFSEIFYFDNQVPCTAPLNISTEVKGIYKTNIYWDQATGDTNSYLVRYREANNSKAEWFTTRTSENWTTLWDLKEGTTYEYQVSSECVLGNSNFSEADTFTTDTAEDESSYYNCGISPDITLENEDPIDELLVGETFMAADFPVKVTEISGSNGRYTGKGRVNIPYLKNIGVSVKFTNILVNTDKALAQGIVVTTYDPTLSNILDVDETIASVKQFVEDVIDDVEDVFDAISGGDHIETSVDFEIDKNAIVVEEDKITIVGTNGESHEIDRDPEDTYEISGTKKVYRVNTDGEIEEVGAPAPGGQATASNTIGVSNSPTQEGNGSHVTVLATNDVAITFRKTLETIYGYDTADSDYEKTIYPKTVDAQGNDVYPPHKAVVNNASDTFEALVDIKNDSISINDLVFKTLSGREIVTQPAIGNVINIDVAGFDGYRSEEVIVTYQKQDSTQVVVSNFFLHHLTLHNPIKLGIVSVNNANITNAASEIAAIYKKAGVEFEITDNINFNIEKSVWDADSNNEITYDGSSNFSNYPSEFRAIYNSFKQAENTSGQKLYDSDTYYILVTDIATSNPIGGFMPRGAQFGFVFNNGTSSGAIENKNTVGITAAHELGHGIFALRHPFEDSGANTSGTDWLMDYGGGNELSQVDWAQIGSEAINFNGFNIFQDDEDNEYNDPELAQKVIQEIRCSFLNNSTDGVDAIKSRLPDLDGFRSRISLANSSVYLCIEYVNEVEINLDRNVVPERGSYDKAGFAFIYNLLGVTPPEVFNFKYNFGGLKIYTLTDDFTEYLIPTEERARNDFNDVWSTINLENNISEAEFNSLKSIAACATQYLNLDQRIELITHISKSNVTIFSERWEDLILDIFQTTPDQDKEEVLTAVFKDFSIFENLYGKMNNANSFGDENNKNRFLNTMYSFWKDSIYENDRYEEFSYENETSPRFIGFDDKSKLLRGFTFSEMSFRFDTLNNEIKIIGEDPGDLDSQIETLYEYNYNPLQPITVYNIADSEEERIGKYGEQVPVFFFMGMENIADVEARASSWGLILDTTLLITGVGELSAIRRATGTYRVIRGTLLGVEIGSSVLDIILNYSTVCNGNTEYCNKIKRVNTWLQICSLSADIFAQRMLKKSINEVIDNPNLPNDAKVELDNLIRNGNNLANTVGKSKIITKLDALGDLTHAKNFVNSLDDVADASLLSKLDELDDVTLSNLDNFYSRLSQNTPSPFTNTDFNFTVPAKSIDIKGVKYVNGEAVEVITTKQVSMSYKRGFAEFHNTEFCPQMSFPDGTTGKFKYLDDNLSMDNYSTHFGKANESLLNKFGIQKGSPKNADGFYQNGNYRWNGSSPQFELRNADGIWEKYTWHHFQDGKTIYPVQSNIHTANIGGFKHAGGNSIFINGIEGIFEFLGF